jgi:hypothetical protein
MSDQEAQSPSQMTQMKPYLIAAGVLIIILFVAFLWPDPDVEQSQTSAPVAVAPALSIVDELATADESENMPPQPDVFEGTPEIKSLEIEVGRDIEPLPDLVVVEPLDESDGAVKSAFISIAASPLVGKYLINEGLLQKFVINVNSIANHEMSPNHSLIAIPKEAFRVYQHADSEWIDAASFKRYDTYVDALESMNTEDLIKLMDTYRSTLESKFAEIAPPNNSFNSALLQAIDELLDTPIIPLPIEVYSDSVMFKFKDEQIEALSGPQKQLIRTGPENTRRIKDILRDLQDALQE